jgi:hypothetical protein
MGLCFDFLIDGEYMSEQNLNNQNAFPNPNLHVSRSSTAKISFKLAALPYGLYPAPRV